MVTLSDKLKFIVAILLLTLLSAGKAYATNIIAYVDRNPVSLDESFQLVLEADGKVDADPDLSVLEKDFDILNTSQSTNMSFINGAMSQKRVWTLALIGKQPGTFTIPSIDFGKDKSPSLRVTIKNPDTSTRQNSAAAAKDIFLEVEVDRKSTWVQSQLVYTVRIFHNVNLNNPSLSQLETSDKDAIIERLGDTKSYEAFRNGIRYMVSELSFAIYPQHSGEFIIKPIVLEGRVSSSRSQSLFDQFMGAGKVIRVRSNSLGIKIDPRPDDIQLKDWLPAAKVTLSEEWSENIQQLKTGEPVTRTITLTADGQMAAYLPELDLADIQGFKQYPDKPLQNNTPSQKGITGSRQIKIAMIPTRAGDYKIPALSIPWWNSKTGKKEMAHLPEVLLKVTGVSNTNANPPAATSNQASPQAGVTHSTPAMAPAQPQADNGSGYWPWVSLALAMLWLITLVAYFRKRPETGPVTGKKPARQTAPIKPLEQAVLTQCRLNNTKQVKDALLAWARARWPDENVTSLADIARLTPPALGEAIMSLNTALYSASKHDWAGKQLCEAFETCKNQVSENKPSDGALLEPLYKT